MNIANSITMDKQPINKPFSSLSPEHSMYIITHHRYLMSGSKFDQRKNTGYPVFLFLVLPPAGIEPATTP